MSGCPNVKPAASSLVGATRWPSSSISSPICPKAAFTAVAGSGKIAGRCRARPRALTKLPVRDGARRDHVDGACERLLEREEIGGNGIVERDPAPPLATAADPSARAELERQQHPGERPAVLREHDPLPQVHGAEPCGTGGLGRSLPRLDHVGQEPRAGHRVLVDDLVAAVAVEPGGGRADEHRTAGEAGGSLGDQARPVHPRVEHSAPHVVAPALADVLSREMDDRLDALERTRRRSCPRRRPIEPLPDRSVRGVRRGGRRARRPRARR